MKTIYRIRDQFVKYLFSFKMLIFFIVKYSSPLTSLMTVSTCENSHSSSIHINESKGKLSHIFPFEEETICCPFRKRRQLVKTIVTHYHCDYYMIEFCSLICVLVPSILRNFIHMFGSLNILKYPIPTISHTYVAI